MAHDPTAARRAALQAEYGGKLTAEQIEAVLSDEAWFRSMGATVSAALRDNGELPFSPLLPEDV